MRAPAAPADPPLCPRISCCPAAVRPCCRSPCAPHGPVHCPDRLFWRQCGPCRSCSRRQCRQEGIAARPRLRRRASHSSAPPLSCSPRSASAYRRCRPRRRQVLQRPWPCPRLQPFLPTAPPLRVPSCRARWQEYSEPCSRVLCPRYRVSRAPGSSPVLPAV